MDKPTKPAGAIKVDPLYNTAEAGQMLGRSAETIRDLIKAGRLAAKRDGRGLYVLGSELQRYISALVTEDVAAEAARIAAVATTDFERFQIDKGRTPYPTTRRRRPKQTA